MDVFVTETVTVLWVHWVIPRVASAQVAMVIKSLQNLVVKSLNDDEAYDDPLDTTKHFFVSKRLADKYPHLLESIIVRSFHSYYPPGRMQKDWPWRPSGVQRTTDNDLQWAWRVFSVGALIVGILRLIGTLDINMQAMLVSMILPGLLAIVTVLLENPIAAICVATVLIILVAKYHVFKEQEPDTNDDDSDSTPKIESAKSREKSYHGKAESVPHIEEQGTPNLEEPVAAVAPISPQCSNMLLNECNEEGVAI